MYAHGRRLDFVSFFFVLKKYTNSCRSEEEGYWYCAVCMQRLWGRDDADRGESEGACGRESLIPVPRHLQSTPSNYIGPLLTARRTRPDSAAGAPYTKVPALPQTPVSRNKPWSANGSVEEDGEGGGKGDNEDRGEWGPGGADPVSLEASPLACSADVVAAVLGGPAFASNCFRPSGTDLFADLDHERDDKPLVMLQKTRRVLTLAVDPFGVPLETALAEAGRADSDSIGQDSDADSSNSAGGERSREASSEYPPRDDGIERHGFASWASTCALSAPESVAAVKSSEIGAPSAEVTLSSSAGMHLIYAYHIYDIHICISYISYIL
jgi:hypothetical protein